MANGIADGTVWMFQELSDCMRVKKRARGLTDTEFVMGMAESVALGTSCLDDLAVNRADVAQAGLRGSEVPAPQTAGAWLRRFTLGIFDSWARPWPRRIATRTPPLR
jgi:hypothetical protein